MELNLWPGLLTLIYFCRLLRGTGKRIYFYLLFKQRLSSSALCLPWNIMRYLTYSKWSIMNKLIEDYVGIHGAQAWIGHIAPQCFRDSCLLSRHFKLKVSSVCKCCSWRKRLLVSLEVLILSGVVHLQLM